jgi:His-Xaa-Ser system protein HxsD
MTLSLDMDLYSREVLYAAAYIFLDRAYVLLDRDGGRFLVHLRGKQVLEEATLRAMAGEFENELLAQELRRMVGKANQKIIEQITNLAITSAAGAEYYDEDFEPGEAAAGNGSTTDVEGGVNDGMDFLEDPQGIATPWEPTRSTDKKKEA